MTFKKFVTTTTQKVIQTEDIDVMFHRIADLHRIHYQFVRALEPIVADLTKDPLIAESFKILVCFLYSWLSISS